MAESEAESVAESASKGVAKREPNAESEEVFAMTAPSAAQIQLHCEYTFYRTEIWHGDGPEPAWDDEPKDIDIELDDLFAWELTLHRTESEPEPVGCGESEAEGGGESATASVREPESESGGESEPEGGGELEPARETASAAIYCAVGREALDARRENIEPESGGESVARSKTESRETKLGISGPEFVAMFAGHRDESTVAPDKNYTGVSPRC